VAGLALTAAFVSGGFCLVRKKRGFALVALFAAVVVFGCSAEKVKVVTYPDPPPTVAVTLPGTVQIDGTILLDVVRGSGDVELIAPAACFVNDKP
jgi:multidrug efflux pump subunit AcrA (membrane-fusion protein)